MANDNDGDKKKDDSKNPKPAVSNPIKKTTDFIKLKLDKLMQNYEKPVVIPERPKGKQGPSVPEFVRNVMGSSAGAGSGEFHVYRHLRRKEYARQKFIQLKSESELKDEEYQKKLEENQRISEEATAKKRAKRQKRKQRLKKLKAQGEGGSGKKAKAKGESEIGLSGEDSESEGEGSESEGDSEKDKADTSKIKRDQHAMVSGLGSGKSN